MEANLEARQHKNELAVSKRASRCLSWIANFFIVLVSVIIICFLAETILMAIVPDPIIWLDPQESYIHDSELIHRLKPNQQSFTHSFPVKTNSFGLRNGEISLEPTANTVRILCLGDSLTFGNGVRFEDTYPKVLEGELNTEELGKYEVINGGVPGYDTWQEIAYLKRDGVHFKPELVVIGVYANDIVPKPANISRIIDSTGFTRKQGLVGLLSYNMIHFLKRSRLLLLLRDRFGKLMNRVSPSPEYQHQDSLLNGSIDTFVQRGWNEVDNSFEELSNLSKKYQFDVVLVLFPMADQVMRNYPTASYPSKVKAIAKKYHLRFVDMTPAFVKSFKGFGSLFIEWDGHPNRNAYQITAREVKRYLLENNMLSRQ
jgi:GDSL-like Lipase/Acylhydrolase family